MTRVGVGYDSHRLVQGRALVLAGVEIDSELGLEGHSDADVATHAVIDALLGAAGLGDIGTHFSASEERWRDADSLELARQTMVLVGRAGLTVGNVDCTVIIERPRLANYIEQMRANLAKVLGTTPDRVSVKATTNESVGFIGRGEGAAAIAVCLLESR